MSNLPSELLDQVVAQISNSARYRTICPDLIRNIAAQELEKQRRPKEAVKATKRKLHQVGGAYLKTGMNYAAWSRALSIASQSNDQTDFRDLCIEILGHHASTAERLPILAQFYATILADLPPVHTIIDIACGFNPLTIPWMSLPPDTEYFAYDIYQDMVDFLNKFLTMAGVNGYAQARDIIRACPNQPVDLAFILKAIPCLDQIDKNAGAGLLDTIDANHLVISFPVHSLGRRHKGMLANYEARFRQLTTNRDWRVKRIEFATELVFVVTK